MKMLTRTITVLIAIGLFTTVSCKDGEKAAESTNKKEGAATTEDKKAATCDDGWVAFSKPYTDKRTEKASKAPDDIKKSVIDGIPKALDEMKEKWMKECAQQKPETVACLVASKTMDEARACRKK